MREESRKKDTTGREEKEKDGGRRCRGKKAWKATRYREGLTMCLKQE